MPDHPPARFSRWVLSDSRSTHRAGEKPDFLDVRIKTDILQVVRQCDGVRFLVECRHVFHVGRNFFLYEREIDNPFGLVTAEVQSGREVQSILLGQKLTLLRSAPITVLPDDEPVIARFTGVDCVIVEQIRVVQLSDGSVA